MTNNTLLLTEHAAKKHSKRLQKKMKIYNQELSLGESQQLFSQILGFNDWNHLNTVLKNNIRSKEQPIETKDSILSPIKKVAIVSQWTVTKKVVSVLLKKPPSLDEIYDSVIFDDFDSCESPRRKRRGFFL